MYVGYTFRNNSAFVSPTANLHILHSAFSFPVSDNFDIPQSSPAPSPLSSCCRSPTMYTPAFGNSPSLGPILIARRDQVDSYVPEDEDDSLAVVFSADTGAGRAHTPQRLNRTHTPQRWVLSWWERRGVRCFRTQQQQQWCRHELALLGRLEHEFECCAYARFYLHTRFVRRSVCSASQEHRHLTPSPPRVAKQKCCICTCG